MSKYQYSVGFALIYKFYVLIILLVDVDVVVVAVVELENWFKLGGDEEDDEICLFAGSLLLFSNNDE